MKIITVFFMMLVSSYLFSQNDQTSFSFNYTLNEDIEVNDAKRYLKARNYFIQDSTFCNKSIYFSPYLADLDLFYFKDVVSKEGDSILKCKLVDKSKWFEDYYSHRLDSTMGTQYKATDYIAFFSLIENDLLRVDIFLYNQNVSSLQFKDVSSFYGKEVDAYLFEFMSNTDEIKDVYKIGINYD